jgi:serine/threonine protein kinase
VSLGERYRVERELGRGDVATVYLARDPRHDRPVALKVLHPELAATVGLGVGPFPETAMTSTAGSGLHRETSG